MDCRVVVVCPQDADQRTDSPESTPPSVAEEDSPAPVITGCTRVERQITARGANADELEALVLPRYAMSPVVIYQAIQYDQDGNVLVAMTTVVPSQHPTSEGCEVPDVGG